MTDTNFRVLKLCRGAFDRTNTFSVKIRPGYDGDTYYGRFGLYRGYQREDDGIYWIMQKGIMMASHYSDAERAETDRLRTERPLRHGDLVRVEGDDSIYRVRVLGNYSDCAILDPVEVLRAAG